MTDERLTLAYQLAYFIHGDAAQAKRIAFAALEKLETAILAQDKRLYYPGRRNKVSMPELHLLQRLVYAESEGEEKRKEQLFKFVGDFWSRCSSHFVVERTA